MKFTVATVTYNAAPELGKTLASVATQTYGEVDHLIIDGASTDGTPALLQQWPRVQVLSEPDSGLYDAMNRAIRLAQGDYLLFLNAGDTFHSPTTLEEVARTIGKERPAVVYGDTHVVDSEGRFVRRRRLSPPERLTWRSFKWGMLVCHQAFFVRTDLAKRREYDLKYRLSADFDWCIRILKDAEQQGLPNLNTHLVVAHFVQGGLSKQRHRQSLQERFLIMRHHYGLPATLALHAFFAIRALFKH